MDKRVVYYLFHEQSESSCRMLVCLNIFVSSIESVLQLVYFYCLLAAVLLEVPLLSRGSVNVRSEKLVLCH